MNEAPVFYAIILWISAMVGGGIFFITRQQSSRSIKLLLSFSAAYLLGLSLLHLFPELFHSGVEHAGWYVMAGFLLQVVLDFFSHGVEHGHSHIHTHSTRVLFLVMVSLWIHAFIEGMPFGGSSVHAHAHMHAHDHGSEHLTGAHDHRDSLLVGIGLHKVTEALVFTALLVSSGIAKQRAFLLLLLFSIVAPAGAFFHYFLGSIEGIDMAKLTGQVTGVLIGILLHVSTTIIFESEEGHRFNWMKFLSVLLGVLAAAIFAAA